MADAFSDRMNETGVPENGAPACTGTSRALVPLTLPTTAGKPRPRHAGPTPASSPS